MRKRRSKTRSYEGTEYRRVSQVASSYVWKLIPLVFFLSCSTLTKKISFKNQSKASLTKELSKLCFSGFGKGSLVIEDETNSFSYESLLESNDSKWSFGIQVPFRDDEDLYLDFKNLKDKRVKITGSIYKQLKRSYQFGKLTHDQFKKIDQFLGQTAILMSLKSNLNLICNEKNCSIPGLVNTLTSNVVDGNLYLRIYSTKGDYLELIASRFFIGKYRSYLIRLNGENNYALSLEQKECIGQNE